MPSSRTKSTSFEPKCHVCQLPANKREWVDAEESSPKLPEAAGIGRWAPYELRHSAVTLLSAAGVPIEELVDLDGHTDARTLMQVYRHQVGHAVDAGVAQADAMFGG